MSTHRLRRPRSWLRPGRNAETNNSPEPSETVVQGQDAHDHEFGRDHRDGPTSYYHSLPCDGRRRADVLEAAAGAAGDDRLTTRPVDWELQRRVRLSQCPGTESACLSSAASCERP